jgi:hypothetical protein
MKLLECILGTQSSSAEVNWPGLEAEPSLPFSADINSGVINKFLRTSSRRST